MQPTSPWSDLTRPSPLVATGLLALNDHVLKGAGVVPGEITGKLSDVAGLFVAPILAVTILRAFARVRNSEAPQGRLQHNGAVAEAGRAGDSIQRDGRAAACVVFLVGVVFTLLKTWPAFNAGVNAFWGPHVLDPSDLCCLPSVLLAWVWLGDRERELGQEDATSHRSAGRIDASHDPARFRSALAAIGTLLICAATPKAPPVPPPSVPMWSIAAKPLALSCGTADVWVAKSGKTGLGVTVRVTPKPNAPCKAAVAASLKFSDRAFTGTPVVTKTGRELEAHKRAGPNDQADPALLDADYHYLAFELDNLERWNRGDRSATFELAIEAGGERKTWMLPATHAYADFPVNVR